VPGANRILAVDVGASKVVLAEFAVDKNRPPQLARYGIGQLGIDPESDTHSSALLVSTLRELMREHAIRPARLYLSISGQAVFPRYVKLPPVTRDKLLQMVRYEAEQNVPFPINEVVWDYQLLPGESALDNNVMLVAVKVESVTRLTDCMQVSRLEPQVVDAAPMALYNAVRYNYPDEGGCELVLDIGARSSNLIFVEERRIFSRSVPVAGNAVTQEIAKQLDMSFDEAEELKKAQAQVDLGGNYEGPADEQAERVAKIVRSVMTRLHAEVNRSINFYRSQQEGSPPSRVLLTGGASITPYTDVFFEDKLQVPVEYLNAFQNITVGEEIDTDRINGDLHLMGEVTGLALRHATSCPIEINLMPPDLVAIKTFRRRQPFFAAAALGVVLGLLAFWGYSRKAQAARDHQLAVVKSDIEALTDVQDRLSTAVADREAIETKVNDIADIIDRRSRWVELLDAIQASLLDGMWLTGLEPVFKDGEAVEILISGTGFHDKLKTYETGDLTAIEVFRDKLRASEAFTEETEILRQPPLGPGGYARDFKMSVRLAHALKD